MKIVSGWFLCAVVACAGCSSEAESPSSTSSDGGTPATDGGGVEDAGAPTTEPAAKPINGCSIGFQDQTAASAPRVLNWDLPVANSPARCMKVKVGQSVKWQGLFSFHPISPKDGDTPNPITPFSASSPDSYSVTFPSAGTFGFVCDAHANMTGAIYVVP